MSAKIEDKRKLETLRKVDDVIFLGAGASASEGSSCQNRLISDFPNCFNNYINSIKKKDCPTTVGLRNFNKGLTNFFRNMFGIDIKKGDLHPDNLPTFEEILGIIDLALDRNQSFKYLSLSPNNPMIQILRDNLVFMIAITLDQKLKNAPPGGTHHTKLINRIREENNIMNTAFISLNYEILIDNALITSYPDYDLDYGVEFINYEYDTIWKRPDPKKSVYLFKLHGSLNWLYCPTCISLQYFIGNKRVATLVLEPQPCDLCKTEMVPIIIPPTFFKVMSNFFLQIIWHKADILLSNAKRIFFCGYSFPDADIHIKYLLKRAEINGGLTPHIYIINNHEDKEPYQKEEEKKRYKRFFKEKEKVIYTEKTFEDFCVKGIS